MSDLEELRGVVAKAQKLLDRIDGHKVCCDHPWDPLSWKIDTHYTGPRLCTELTFKKLNANILTIGSTDSDLAIALSWCWEEFFGLQVKGGNWDPTSLMGDGAPELPTSIYAGRIDQELHTLLLSIWFGDNRQTTPWVFQDETYSRTQWMAIGILLLAPFCFKSALFINGPVPEETFTFPDSERQWTIPELLDLILRGRRLMVHIFQEGKSSPWKNVLASN